MNPHHTQAHRQTKQRTALPTRRQVGLLYECAKPRDITTKGAFPLTCTCFIRCTQGPVPISMAERGYGKDGSHRKFPFFHKEHHDHRSPSPCIYILYSITGRTKATGRFPLFHNTRTHATPHKTTNTVALTLLLLLTLTLTLT